MAKKKAQNSAISNAQKLGIGVGLTTAAVAAAGAYFLYGSKNAPKNRKTVKSWALKAKGEVLEALEKAEKITEEEFNTLVNGVVTTYGKAQKLSSKELSDFKKEMGENWTGLVKSGAAKVYQTAGAAKSVAQKMTKKAPAKKTTVAKKVPVKKTIAKAVAKKAPAKKAVTKKAA
jgi:hypothetical protein